MKRKVYEVVLTEEQQELRELMSDISERCYCAGWLDSLEFTLWATIKGERSREFGMGEITEREVTRLQDLHRLIGGWIRWDDELETERGWANVFVTTEEWEKIYAAAWPAEVAAPGGLPEDGR